jgi:hypothetical protein
MIMLIRIAIIITTSKTTTTTTKNGAIYPRQYR